MASTLAKDSEGPSDALFSARRDNNRDYESETFDSLLRPRFAVVDLLELPSGIRAFYLAPPR